MPDKARCVTSDAKRAGNVLLLVGETTAQMGGSVLQSTRPESVGGSGVPRVDLDKAPRAARAVHGLIKSGLIASAHDCSDGGLLVAVAEMLIGSLDCSGGVLGCEIDLSRIVEAGAPLAAAAFGESPTRWVLEVSPEDMGKARKALEGAACVELGRLTGSGRLRVGGVGVDLAVADLHKAWTTQLDW